jgi:hypothetical protein
MAKQIDTKTSSAVALSNTFEDDADGGLKDMGQGDLALPFLRLLTNVSPEIGEVDGALPGMLYNSVTGELYDGKKGVLVVPTAYVRQYIEWAPRGSGGGAPLTVYPSTSDILSKTHREVGDTKDYLDNGNYIENTANHYVMLIVDGVPSPALIVMKSTQLKKSRKWNSMMLSVKLPNSAGALYTPPMYSQVYRLTTVGESNDKGKWFGWEVERVGSVEDPNVYAAAKSFSATINSGAVKVKHSSDAEEEAGTQGHIF